MRSVLMEVPVIENIEAIAKGGTAAGEVAAKLFPGIPARSNDNAASSCVNTAESDIEDVLAWADKAGVPDDLRNIMLNYVFEKRGSNQRVADCFKFAAPQIEDDADVGGLDQEWLDYWRMHAEKARSEDVQAIWGAILAGEVNNSGAVSKRAMSILADMEKRDAETLVKLCSYCAGGKMGNGKMAPLTPMLIDVGERFAMNPEDIARLRSLGVVDFNLGVGFGMSSLMKCQPGSVFQIGKITFIVIGDGKAEFSVKRFPFTEYGLQLASYCTIGEGEGFADGLVQHWKSLGFHVGIVQEWLGDGQIKYQLI